MTARPSYSRIKTRCRRSATARISSCNWSSGRRPSRSIWTAVDYIESDGFKINARVYMVLEGRTRPRWRRRPAGPPGLATVFDNLKPHLVVTIGDRYETLATAVAASYMNIPVAHVQGGEVTGSIDEKVRHAVTKLSDLHLVSTEFAAQRVIRMGEEPGTVFVTGCPSIDLAAAVLDRPNTSFDPFAKYGGVGAPFSLESGYWVRDAASGHDGL